MMLEMSAPTYSLEQQLEMDWHCVLYHKQRTSARTRFLRIGRDVVYPEPPVDDCEPLDEAEASGSPIRQHPASGLGLLSRELGIAIGELRVDGEPLARIGQFATPVWLVEVTSTDPPLDEVSAIGGRFVSIMDARDVPREQQELLRSAYERILG